MLQDTIERIYVADTYGDIPRGIFIIRGENVVLLGEIVRILSLCLSLLRSPVYRLQELYTYIFAAASVVAI